MTELKAEAQRIAKKGKTEKEQAERLTKTASGHGRSSVCGEGADIQEVIYQRGRTQGRGSAHCKREKLKKKRPSD